MVANATVAELLSDLKQAAYTYEGTDTIQSLIRCRAVTGMSAFPYPLLTRQKQVMCVPDRSGMACQRRFCRVTRVPCAYRDASDAR